MLSAIATGLIAAGVVSLGAVIRQPNWSAPVFLLAVAVVAMLIQRFGIERKPGDQTYNGMADLFIHIHLLSSPDSPARWTMRGLISFLLNLAGGTVGAEGAATEISHAAALKSRTQSSHWFEQRRRTDVASAIAAGIAAAFGAPFTAVLITIELGIGGRTLSAALSAITAFVSVMMLQTYYPFMDRLSFERIALGDGGNGLDYNFFYRINAFGLKAWLAFAFVILGVSLLSVLVIRLIQYCQEGLMDLFKTEAWMRVMAGGILLFLVALVYTAGHAPSWHLLEQALSAELNLAQVSLISVTQILTLALVLSAFGTVGVFWPLFAIGGFAGYAIYQTLFPVLGLVGLGDSAGLGVILGLAGASAMWSGVLGLPIAATVIAFELTYDVHVLLPCFLAALVAREVRTFFRTRPLIQNDLDARGLTLFQGRSMNVLESILVRDAMVTDHESVYEHEPIADLHAKLLKSKHPFLPVVNRLGHYVGLLTIDMIRDGFRTEPNSPLSRLFEAKDLLYKTHFKMPTVKAGDKLTITGTLFDQSACIAVLADDSRVIGLLFAYNVRVAYEREVARRSLTF
jgi:H+/Cl- antiporter ClcA